MGSADEIFSLAAARDESLGADVDSDSTFIDVTWEPDLQCSE